MSEVEYVVQARLKNDPISAHLWTPRGAKASLEEARRLLEKLSTPRPGKRREDFEFRIVRVAIEVVE